ncbi:hypothetical protein CVS30_07910 [Arthrobacter psychrolactophilus]|uniref:Putative Flp pilus-assembly TadG-like N-terminal domain-containing protein n=1 Tax=Arthrobacter psychrolactophilus TaxID=92442 RepID=A0A2V5JLN2_9MICC|nr:TadE/TadG family type IV pilus assembly protein [Arthrobacter psychrolactophilus]PYI38756.1 hypothetical protein CVS30_07910 [Arthrobacter psychrolactophilus]
MWRIKFRLGEGNLHDQHGATAVMTAILMVVLLAFAAISIDVGILYAQRTQLQNGADAAVLAVANDCARGTCDHGANDNTGNTFAGANSNDGAALLKGISYPTGNSVEVTVSKDAAGGNPVTLFFANIFGISQADVSASATAAWGPPESGNTLPWTFGKCIFDQLLTQVQKDELAATGDFTGNPVGTHLLIAYNETARYPGCTDDLGNPSGGFGWLDRVGSSCKASIDVGTSEAGSDPGIDFPGVCVDVLPSLLENPTLIPIFSTSGGSGNNATFTIYGFAAFQTTGWRLSGNPALNHPDSLAPPCGGSCRGIYGFFTRFVSLEEGMTFGNGPNLGGSIVRLTN